MVTRKQRKNTLLACPATDPKKMLVNEIDYAK
jgi:hypothetical protein